MTDMPTGLLVKLYRVERKKNTTNVATHVGISKRYLEMIESGTKTPSIDVLRRLAKVLGVRTSALIGGVPSEDHEGDANPRLAAIERALFTYKSASLSGREEAPELPDLSGRIRAAWDWWFGSTTKFSDVLGVLPDLIVDAELAVQATNRSREACRQASEVYQLARPVLKHSGRADLGPLVSDRIMRYAEESEDPLLIAAATWNLGQALLSDDMPEGAFDLAMSAAEQMVTRLPDGDPEVFSVYGGLIQLAAIAATRNGDPWRARELLRGDVRQAATRLGDNQNFHHLVFGPSNLAMHMVGVEFENGDYGEALRISNDVDITRMPSLERKTSHLYQVARCYDQRNNDTAVFVHLQMAEHLCPQDFRYKRGVREMVTSLVKRAKPSYAGEVRDFANRVGLLA
jgi:transcriptional regulator with XRE-family HTH domain